MFGQSLGPVFGGLLAQFLGYHAIFWALTILGGLSLLLTLAFLPETLRSIAGNGSVRLTGRCKPWIYHLRAQPLVIEGQELDRPRAKVKAGIVFHPLQYLLEKDIAVSLLFGAVVYTIWSMVTSTTTGLFQARYGLNELQIGLVFIPNGQSDCFSRARSSL